MKYSVHTVAEVCEFVGSYENLSELAGAVDYCFNDAEHGIVWLVVHRLRRDGFFDGRTQPAFVIYDHGLWQIRGTGIVAVRLCYIVNYLYCEDSVKGGILALFDTTL